MPIGKLGFGIGSSVSKSSLTFSKISDLHYSTKHVDIKKSISIYCFMFTGIFNCTSASITLYIIQINHSTLQKSMTFFVNDLSVF